MTTEVAIATPTPRSDAVAEPSARRGLDWFEASVLALFTLVSLWLIGTDLWQVVVHHLTWTDTDGLFLADQMQYLAWIQDASRHFLISDMFVLHSTPHDYFMPIIVVSGGLVAAGVPAWLSLLLWKPVAILAGFFAVRAYTRRTLTERFDRRLALVLALFFGGWGVIGDEWMPFWTWGYPFGLLAVAAIVGALLSYDRARRRGGFTWIPALLGLTASLIHPWQGELLILIVIGTEAVTWRRADDLRRRIVLPGVTLIATVAPLLYYEALYRFDIHWKYAQQASKHNYSLSGILIPLIPLLIASALAYRRRPQSFIAAATRVWPFAALVIFALSETGLSGTPLHAFAGITIPLAVLSVEGVQHLGLRRLPAWRWVAVLLVAGATIPALVFELRTSHDFNGPMTFDANFINPDVRQALNYLADDPQSGGVLARQYIGLIVPAETGRKTYDGSGQWTQPNRQVRVNNTQNLFEGKLNPTEARAFVRSTSARFLLQDCESPPNVLPKLLGPMIQSVKRFGCAAVYEVS